MRVNVKNGQTENSIHLAFDSYLSSRAKVFTDLLK